MNRFRKRPLALLGGIPASLILAGCLIPMMLKFTGFDPIRLIVCYGIAAGLTYAFIIFSSWEEIE